ncbi:MAG: hypothetical protein H7A39_02335 [Chlamydiales bacterium]|nr:hypothetical protein [Chlamydiales bacterium]
MAHDDEFEKIMKFFSMDQKERSSHFSEVFEKSAEFFEKFNHVMKEGSLEDKQRMIAELQELQRVVQEETEKLTNMTGMSEEELKAFAENKNNFTPEQWEMVQQTRSRIQKDTTEVSNLIQFNEPGSEQSHKPKKPKNIAKKKTDWLKS